MGGPRYSALLRLLRFSLVAGAVYDAAYALVMVAAADLPARWLSLPKPGEDFYLWLIAVFLLMLAGFYLLAAYDPLAYRGNIDIAIVGRLAGGVVFLLAASGRPELAGLYVLAAGDLFFAVVHAALWLPIRP